MAAWGNARSVPAAFLLSILLHLGAAACVSARYHSSQSPGPLPGAAATAHGPLLQAVLLPDHARSDAAPAPAVTPSPIAGTEPRAAHPDPLTPARAQDAAAPEPATQYRPAGELSRRPRLIVAVEPAFPAGAAGGTIEGVVLLRVMVNERGLVDDVEIESADLPVAFQEAARTAFLGAAYHPGERDGSPVKSWVRVEVAYAARNHRIPALP
jgi:TonB family protein